MLSAKELTKLMVDLIKNLPILDRLCINCEEITEHRYVSDSTGDMSCCSICGCRYNNMTGEWSEPFDYSALYIDKKLFENLKNGV
jgi:hypothetical protein